MMFLRPLRPLDQIWLCLSLHSKSQKLLVCKGLVFCLYFLRQHASPFLYLFITSFTFLRALKYFLYA